MLPPPPLSILNNTDDAKQHHHFNNNSTTAHQPNDHFLTNVAKIPPMHNSQQQQAQRYNPFQLLPSHAAFQLATSRPYSSLFKWPASTVKPVRGGATSYAGGDGVEMASFTNTPTHHLNNDLAFVSTVSMHNEVVVKPHHHHHRLAARKHVTSNGGGGELPSESSQQMLNTIATSFSELETLKRFAQLPGRGEMPPAPHHRHIHTARRHPRFHHHQHQPSMRPAFYSNPQLWKEVGAGGETQSTLPNSLTQARVLPTYSKHNLSRSDIGTSPKINTRRLHHSESLNLKISSRNRLPSNFPSLIAGNMTLPLTYNDKSAGPAMRMGTMPLNMPMPPPPPPMGSVEDNENNSETTI